MGTNFRHFRTFSAGADAFLSCSDSSRSLLTQLVVDSFRIGELLQICYGSVVQLVMDFL